VFVKAGKKWPTITKALAYYTTAVNSFKILVPGACTIKLFQSIFTLCAKLDQSIIIHYFLQYIKITYKKRE